MRNPRPLLYIALIFALLNLVHHREPVQQLPLIKADYQRCVMIHNAPLDDGSKAPVEGDAPVSKIT